MRTTNIHRRARITDVETRRLRETIDAGIVPVVAGFQGVDDDGDITTIGRGGSDTSAVALAVALKADECQILTDVDGVYTTDPRMVPEARLLERISFEEMLELAGQGSRVLHLRSVEFAAKYNVPLRVLSSFRPGPGTLICKEETQVEAPLISGIAFNRDEAQITVSGSAGHGRLRRARPQAHFGGQHRSGHDRPRPRPERALRTCLSPCIATTSSKRSGSRGTWLPSFPARG